MRVTLVTAITVLLFVGMMIAYTVSHQKDTEMTDKPAPGQSAALPGEPVTGEPVATATGLKYYDLKVGDGPTPPSRSSTVEVHYTGWLTNGKKFDSSRDHGGPIKFPLNGVIAGWTEGVGSMKVGGKRKLIVPASLGYGAGGQGDIPGGATLVFDVELLAIK